MIARVNAPISNLKCEDIKKVVEFFANHDSGTAKEIDVSGSFMRSLVNRGAVTVIGEKEGGFYPVGHGYYKKATSHIYALSVTPCSLVSHWCAVAKNEALKKKQSADLCLAAGQEKINEARKLLAEAESF